MSKYIVYMRPRIKAQKFTIEAENYEEAKKLAFTHYYLRSYIDGKDVLEIMPKFVFYAINEVNKEKLAIRKRRIASIREFFERIVERLKQAETTE